MSPTQSHATWIELASRANEGLEVFLLWNSVEGRVKVAIADARLDEQFEFDVAGADALAAFYHPFAYAAGRDLRLGNAVREPLALEGSAA